MRFDFDDEQREIKETARSFLAARFKADTVRELAESGTYDEAHWSEISELGWTGIAIDEDAGGQGLGLVELVILCEELGYACAPTPFLANAAAGIAISLAGSDAQRSAHLEGIATGSARGGAGEPGLVADAQGASVIAVFDGDGATLVEGSSATIEDLDLIDSTRRYARLDASGGEALGGDVTGARDRIAIAVAAELVGIAQRAMEMSVEYAKERHQFDRPIGSYQAVSHQCAQMLYETEEARSLTYAAAWAADAEPENLTLAAAMAKARASEAAWAVTKSAIQVHGGIGFTWEHDLHFLLKRARADGELFGSAGRHRARVADLAGLAA
jgi:alkylation response protein AidB-like acyl-CoA dehydrogenase